MTRSKHPDRKRVGPYTIVERLGEGGMGIVYRGKSKEGEAAVKVIRESMLEREDIRTRFTREIETLQAIQSNHVARILGSDMSKKTAWIATEFVAGRSLKDLVDTDGPLDEQAWDALADGLLEGLEAIHNAGVIHQDVKPANVMMSPEGPKIIDFGISREIGSTRVTMTGMFAGSAGWMAPERAELDIETTASDVFSAGLVLAFAALGKHPWDGETSQSDVAITLSMLSKSPDLSLLTQRQRTLVEAMLQMNAEERPSASTALDIVRGAIVTPTTPPPKKFNGLQKKRWSLAVRALPKLSLTRSVITGFGLAIVAVALTFLGGFAVASGGGSDRAFTALEVSAWLLGDSLGFVASAAGFDWLLASDSQVTSTIGFRPALLTIVLLFLIARFSRKVASSLDRFDWTKAATHIALFSLPLLLTITTLRLFLAGPIVLSGSKVLMLNWTALDFIFALGLVFVSALVGVFLGRPDPASSAVGWVYVALKRGAPVFFAIIGTVLVSLVLYSILAPSFLSSIQPSNSMRPFLDYGPQEYTTLVLFFLTFLPALVFGYLSFVVAGRGGVFLQRDNSLVLEGLQPSSGPALSPWQALLPEDFLFATLFVLLVALTGLVSGASVLSKTGIGPTNFRGMLKVAAVTTSVVALAVVIGPSIAFSAQGAWSSTALVLGSDRELYLSLLSALVLGLVLSASIIAGSRPAVWKFLVQALPRTIFGTRAFKQLEDKNTSGLPKLAGLATLALIALVALAPVAIASTERVLAAQATPEKVASQLADNLERGDLTELVEELSSFSGSSLPWLPMSVIESARPSPGASRSISVVNSNGTRWALGETDAVATVKWSDSDGGPSWDLPMEGSLKRTWRYLRTLEYTPRPEPVVLKLSNEDVDGEDVTLPSIRVNGEIVDEGVYLSVPGTYGFSREGIGFLAAHSSVASSEAAELVVSIAAELKVPEGADSLIVQAIDEVQDSCGGLGSSRCIEYDEISRYMQVQSGQVPANYYTSSESGYSRGDVRCSEGANELEGVYGIVHVAECFQIVTAEDVYYDSREIAEPVYSVRCSWYSYSWFWGWYCADYESYQSGTNYRTVVGSPIATVRYEAQVPFRVHLKAALEEDGTFVVESAEAR